MRTTIFRLSGERVETEVSAAPDWRPFDQYNGKRLQRVRLVEVVQPPRAEIQMVEIQVGGQFAMHSSPDIAFCQILRGRGKLGLPDGTALSYQGPELYVFFPGTLHDWHDIEEDTILSVCLVKHAAGLPGSGSLPEETPRYPEPHL